MAARLGAQLSSHGLRQQQALKRAGICVDWLGRCAALLGPCTSPLHGAHMPLPSVCQEAAGRAVIVYTPGRDDGD